MVRPLGRGVSCEPWLVDTTGDTLSPKQVHNWPWAINATTGVMQTTVRLVIFSKSIHVYGT